MTPDPEYMEYCHNLFQQRQELPRKELAKMPEEELEELLCDAWLNFELSEEQGDEMGDDYTQVGVLGSDSACGCSSGTSGTWRSERPPSESGRSDHQGAVPGDDRAQRGSRAQHDLDQVQAPPGHLRGHHGLPRSGVGLVVRTSLPTPDRTGRSGARV